MVTTACPEQQETGFNMASVRSPGQEAQPASTATRLSHSGLLQQPLRLQAALVALGLSPGSVGNQWQKQ